MVRIISRGERTVDMIINFLLILITIIMLYPFVYVTAMSFSSERAIALYEVWLWPVEFNIENFILFYERSVINIFRAYWNSILYAALTVVGSVIFCTLTAYPLIKKDLVFRKAIVMFIMIPMLFGGTFIQDFILYSQLGIINTKWAIVLPAIMSTWRIIIIVTFFASTISVSLRESALIDGASEFRILLFIYVPLSKPIIAIVALFAFVSQWNNYFAPFLYLHDINLYTLPLVLQRAIEYQEPLFAGEMLTEPFRQGMQSAAMVVSFVPILLIYPFMQRYFVQGVQIGSIKG